MVNKTIKLIYNRNYIMPKHDEQTKIASFKTCSSETEKFPKIR